MEKDATKREGWQVIIRNEFAAVEVELDSEGNGDRLRVEDLDSGRVVYLDALQLENIVWMPDDELSALMDPSRHRWRDEQRTIGGDSE